MGIISIVVKRLQELGETPDRIVSFINELEAEIERSNPTAQKPAEIIQENQCVPEQIERMYNILNKTHTRKGKGGVGEKGNLYHSDLEFLRFWNLCPRREAKGGAFRAWKSALKRGATADEIIAGMERFAKRVEGTEKQFICLPQTWLNQDRWADEETQAKPKTVANSYAWETEKANYIDKHGVKAWYDHIAQRRKARENNAVVCGDGESPQGRTGSKEPKMARISDFLPTLPTMDQPTENQTPVFAEALPDPLSVCGSPPAEPFDLPDQQHDWGLDGDLLWAASASDSSEYSH